MSNHSSRLGNLWNEAAEEEGRSKGILMFKEYGCQANDNNKD